MPAFFVWSYSIPNTFTHRLFTTHKKWLRKLVSNRIPLMRKWLAIRSNVKYEWREICVEKSMSSSCQCFRFGTCSAGCTGYDADADVDDVVTDATPVAWIVRPFAIVRWCCCCCCFNCCWWWTYTALLWINRCELPSRNAVADAAIVLFTKLFRCDSCDMVQSQICRFGKKYRSNVYCNWVFILNNFDCLESVQCGIWFNCVYFSFSFLWIKKNGHLFNLWKVAMERLIKWMRLSKRMHLKLKMVDFDCNCHIIQGEREKKNIEWHFNSTYLEHETVYDMRCIRAANWFHFNKWQHSTGFIIYMRKKIKFKHFSSKVKKNE